MKQTVQTEEYCYYDPKQLKQFDQAPKTKTAFQEEIVFIVGGGNYIEYQNLMDYVKVSIWTKIHKFHLICIQTF